VHIEDLWLRVCGPITRFIGDRIWLNLENM
jgi:hypothetical protein